MDNHREKFSITLDMGDILCLFIFCLNIGIIIGIFLINKLG